MSFVNYRYISFTGSRNITPATTGFVTNLARVAASVAPVAVGCASGTDSAVRIGAPAARVFRASSFQNLPYKAALVARSSALVHHTAAHNPALIIGFPTTACPASITPAPVWRSGGSGTWSTLALAAWLGVTVLIYAWALPQTAASLPASFGSWQHIIFLGEHFYQLTPAASQTTLF